MRSLLVSADSPGTWPIDDAVLAMLVPELKAEVESFHAGRGRSLSDIVPEHRRIQLDHELCELLTRALARAASASVDSANH